MVPRLEPSHLHLRARGIQLKALRATLLHLRDGVKTGIGARPRSGVSFVNYCKI